MDISSSDLHVLVFRRVSIDKLGEVSLDGQMLSVLMEMDGKKSLSAIAKKLDMNPGNLRGVISRLLKLELVEPADDAISMLEKDFFDFLMAQLSLAVGPIAEILIEDAVNDLGHSVSRFPGHRAAELVDALAREIRREEKRVTFQQAMLEKIKDVES